MFCGKCGNQIPDGAAFCPNCGNAMGSEQPQPQVQTQEQPTVQYDNTQSQMQYDTQGQFYDFNGQNTADPYNPYTPAPKKKITKNTVIGIAAVAVVAVAVIVALILIIGGLGKGEKSAEAAAEAYINAMAELDTNALLDCIHDDVLNYIAEDEYDGNVKELKKELSEEFSDQKEDGWDINIKKYKVKENEKLSRDELKELKEKYEDEDIDISISEARDITLKFTVKGEIDDEDIDESLERTIRVIKVGRRWYIDITSNLIF